MLSVSFDAVRILKESCKTTSKPLASHRHPALSISVLKMLGSNEASVWVTTQGKPLHVHCPAIGFTHMKGSAGGNSQSMSWVGELWTRLLPIVSLSCSTEPPPSTAHLLELALHPHCLIRDLLWSSAPYTAVDRVNVGKQWFAMEKVEIPFTTALFPRDMTMFRICYFFSVNIGFVIYESIIP